MTPNLLNEVSIMLAVLANMGANGVDVDAIDRKSLQCLAKNVYYESRGEEAYGKLAVANVTLNRMKSKNYPNTICDVVYDHNKTRSGKTIAMFSWTLDSKPNDVKLQYDSGQPIVLNIKAWRESITISALTLTGELKDITSGATHFFAHQLVTPRWSKSDQYTFAKGLPNGRVGNHTFMAPTY